MKTSGNLSFLNIKTSCDGASAAEVEQMLLRWYLQKLFTALSAVPSPPRACPSTQALL